MQLPPAGRSEITPPQASAPPYSAPNAPELSEITSTKTVAVRDDDKRKDLWDMLRDIFKDCGKPVSVELMIVCRAEFFKYPLEVQKRIVEDAMARVALDEWNEPKWTPYPLKYLRSRDWDVKPIQQRKFPQSAPNKQQEKLNTFRRLFDRAVGADREEPLK